MLMDEDKLLSAYDNIKKNNTKEAVLAWLLTDSRKCAVLTVFQDKDSFGYDCVLSDTEGRELFRHSYTSAEGSYDPYAGSYPHVIEYFKRCYDNECATVSDADTSLLISKAQNELEKLYRTDERPEWMREAFVENTQAEVRYICTVYKLNKLFGIMTEDMQDSFYLRFGAADKNGSIVLFHDIEYTKREDGSFTEIDDFILDAKIYTKAD